MAAAWQLLWGKTQPTGDHPWHPLLYHMIDVAAVMGVLWERAMTSATRKRVCDSLGCSPEQAQRFLSLWAGLHDIGKASPGFQNLVPELTEPLREHGFGFRPGAVTIHPIMTTAVINKEFAYDDDCAALIRALALVLGAHHGSFPSYSDLIELTSKDFGGEPWRQAREELIQQLITALDMQPPFIPPGLKEQDNAFFVFLCGFISVADWIGSSQEHFSATAPEYDAMQYMEIATNIAHNTVEQLGWTGWEPPNELKDFKSLWDFQQLRDMQQKVVDIAQQTSEPELILIEAPMGEGKTEAAFYLADTWNTKLEQRGCYVAMPTQATANAMFSRFKDGYLAKRYVGKQTNLHLIHGQAVLSQEYQQLAKIAQVWDNDGDGAIVAREWFTHRKRGLLGPFAVGTVDQALLAVMQARHNCVRLFGLADKTIIFDEVHAFDTYTSELLDRLLEWLGRLNCSVVLLSATLPTSRRYQLMEAYAGRSLTIDDTPYPRITRVSHNNVEVKAFSCQSKTVNLEWVPPVDELIAYRLRSELANGGCVAVVCNTVKRAQEMYSTLRDVLAPDGVEVDLFHAHFPFNERDKREKRALARFGKNGDRPHRAVLVATQVIEQSLDLDFDLMISELAPVDLILQRAGRMHRHEQLRPPAFAEPCLWIMEPIRSDECIDFGASRNVYGDYLLLKSWLALQGVEKIHIPEDVERLILLAYEQQIECDDGVIAQQLKEAEYKFKERQDRLKNEAGRRLMRSPAIDEEFSPWDTLADEDSDTDKALRAMTRYSDMPSVGLVCLQMVNGQPCIQTQEGFIPVDMTQKPDRELESRLIERSVRLSGYIAGYFLSQPVPECWQKSALLRYYRAACFNEDNRIHRKGFTLTLDDELGIVIEYIKKGEKQ